MKKILIVEDTESTRKVLALKLTKEHFNVLEAENGKIGLEVALKEKPDLLIVDMLMPVMDGFKMIDKLRADKEWGVNANVMILTNLTPTEDIYDKIGKAKLLFYMVKDDWALNDLCNKVKELIGEA